MAHDRRWYKRNPGDFLMGTVGLDLETVGAYSMILDVLNDRDRPLPDDDRFIAGILRVSPRKWRGLRETLLAAGKLIVLRDGTLSNPRFERERAERHAEREAAVQAGRQGGLKSAAQRAGQGDLPLENDAKTTRKRAENEPKTPRTDREREPDPAENNDLAEAPPQPSRARQRTELRDTSTPSDIAPPPRAHAHTPAREEDDSALIVVDVGVEPLLDFVSRLGALAGLNFTQPARLTAAIDQVKEWEAAGIDRATIEETIVLRVQNAPAGDGSYSLKRFDAPVRTEHGRRLGRAKAAPGKPSRPTPVPRFTFEDEDARFEPIRRALIERVGQRLYVNWFAEVRLHAEGRTIRLNGSPFHAQKVLNDFAPDLLAVARPIGFTAVR